MSKSIELNLEQEAVFLELTRVYKLKGSTTIKSQPITVARSAIAGVRPSNRLGKADHRSTLTLIDGTNVDLAETYSTVTSDLMG